MQAICRALLLGLFAFALSGHAQASRPVAAPAFDMPMPRYEPDARIPAIVHRHHYARHAARRHRDAVAHKRVPVRAPAPAPEHAARLPAPAGDSAQATAVGKMLGIADGWADGIATALPIMVQAPRRIAGLLDIDGVKFPFVSGGHGWSIPYGDFPVTPDDMGDWGYRHGALGINGNAIWDHRLGRDRQGIEMHGEQSGSTGGCVGFAKGLWPAVKAKVLAMMAQYGHAFLHVDPWGARLSPTPHPLVVVDVPGLLHRVADIVVSRRHARVRYAHHPRRGLRYARA